eukprot:636383-Rhodomonas_salina.2
MMCHASAATCCGGSTSRCSLRAHLVLALLPRRAAGMHCAVSLAAKVGHVREEDRRSPHSRSYLDRRLVSVRACETQRV